MKDHQRATLSLCILFIALLEIFNPTSSSAQRTGEHAEMDRLEQQAHDLAAQSDPEGAALAIGKAAMMADLLTKKAQKPATQDSFQAASLLYRAQELGLRALALFDRIGGIPPAPVGICQYLSQAHKKLAGAKTLLENTPDSSQKDIKIRRDHLLKKINEWQAHLQVLHEDFACSAIPNE